MKKHITEAFIERIRPPKSGLVEVFDLGYPGLALRVGHGGAKSFRLYFRADAKLEAKRLGRWPDISLAAARDEWRKTREAVAKGEAPQQRKSNAMLFEIVVEEWLKRDMAERNTASSLRQVTRMVDGDLLPAWRGRPIDAITKKDCIALLDAVADRGARVKANRVHAALSRLFKWAAGREIISASPMNGLERPSKENARERTLTDQELAKVWHGASKLPVLGDVVKLLALTGMRREEATQLRWSEIDGATITLDASRCKNGTAHIVPLSKPAQALLAGLPRIAGSEYVFTLNGRKPITGWSRAKHMLDESCGVNDWRLHDLRRTMATGCQKLGVTLQTVEAILGHTSGSRAGVIGVYQRHDFAAEKASAMEKWGNHVMKLVKE
jgi:integrase